MKVGICGSDMHYWINGYIGDFVVKSPIILGHETSAVVVKCGKNVTKLQEGFLLYCHIYWINCFVIFSQLSSNLGIVDPVFFWRIYRYP